MLSHENGVNEQMLRDVPSLNNTLTAVPPTVNGSAMINAKMSFNRDPRGRSNSEAVLFGRLRACSEGQRQGHLSVDEKVIIKKLILSKDPRLQEEFDRALSRGDWNTIKCTISNVRVPSAEEEAIGVINNIAGVNLQQGNTLSALVDEDGLDFSNVLFDPFYETVTINDSDQQQGAALDRNGSYVSPSSSSPSNNYDADTTISPSRKRQASRGRLKEELPSMLPETAGSKRVKPEGVEGRGNVHRFSRLNGLKPHMHGSLMRQLKGEVAESFLDVGIPDDDSSNKDSVSKHRKNERERKRRLAVSRGFEELAEILKPDNNRSHANRLDKATILQSAIDTIVSLERKVEYLSRQNRELLARMSKQNVYS